MLPQLHFRKRRAAVRISLPMFISGVIFGFALCLMAFAFQYKTLSEQAEKTNRTPDETASAAQAAEIFPQLLRLSVIDQSVPRNKETAAETAPKEAEIQAAAETAGLTQTETSAEDIYIDEVIENAGITGAETPVPAASIYAATEAEIRLVAKLAHFEDRSSEESLMAVAEVVLNRVLSPEFPDTVEEVVYQAGYINGRMIRQFAAAYTEAFRVYEPTGAEIEAVRSVFGGKGVFGSASLYFAAKYVAPSKIARGLEAVGECGGSRFYRQTD